MKSNNIVKTYAKWIRYRLTTPILTYRTMKWVTKPGQTQPWTFSSLAAMGVLMLSRLWIWWQVLDISHILIHTDMGFWSIISQVLQVGQDDFQLPHGILLQSLRTVWECVALGITNESSLQNWVRSSIFVTQPLQKSLLHEIPGNERAQLTPSFFGRNLHSHPDLLHLQDPTSSVQTCWQTVNLKNMGSLPNSQTMLPEDTEDT